MNAPGVQRGLPMVGRGAETSEPCPAQTLRSPRSRSSLQVGPTGRLGPPCATCEAPSARAWGSPVGCSLSTWLSALGRPPTQPSCSLLAAPEAASLLSHGERPGPQARAQARFLNRRSQPHGRLIRMELPPASGPASQLPVVQRHPARTPHGSARPRRATSPHRVSRSQDAYSVGGGLKSVCSKFHTTLMRNQV